MLAHYHRWIRENGRWQSVETLREFIIQEAELQTVASETTHDLSKRVHKKDSGVTFFSSRRNLQEIREELDFDRVKFAVVIMRFGAVTGSRLWAF